MGTPKITNKTEVRLSVIAPAGVTAYSKFRDGNWNIDILATSYEGADAEDDLSYAINSFFESLEREVEQFNLWYRTKEDN